MLCFVGDGLTGCNRESFFSEVAAYKTINPLITAVIIGDYSNSKLPSIKTVNKDYQNIIDAFNITHGYTVVLAQNCADNNNEYVLKRFGCGNQTKSCNFKTKWSSEEIEEFSDKIKHNFIENDNTSFDSLIFIVSCHGDGKDLIYDSNGEHFSLGHVYYRFDNKNCRNMRSKPKIYLFDIYKIGSGDSSGIYKTNININNDQQDEKSDILASDVVITKNKDPKSKEVCAATYTKDTHCRKIVGNSGQQPASDAKIDASIFIQCFTESIKYSTNASLGHLVAKTRKRMAIKLDLARNGGDLIALSDEGTMPYEIKFRKSNNDFDTKMNQYSNSILQQTVRIIYIYICIYIQFCTFLHKQYLQHFRL